MNAKKCDICGCFYDIYGGENGDNNQCNALKLIAVEKEKSGEYWGVKLFEFCPECKKKIYQFLNIK